mgnify:CR=1 FL=1
MYSFSLHARAMHKAVELSIWREDNLPTVEQAVECVYVCQMLSNLLQDIRLFRFDERRNEVFILAGEDIQVVVPSKGAWKFYEPEL